MTLNEFQETALSVAKYPKDGLKPLFYTAMGLAGEAGEVVGKVRKILRDDNEVLTQEKKDQLKDEAGDVLWFVATFSKELGFTLEEIAQRNVEKLASRVERNVVHGSGDNR